MNNQKDHQWHKIANSFQELNLRDSSLTELCVNDKKICLALYKGEIYACADKCPHASGSLANGYIDALGNIVCPMHRYKFSLQNGRNTSGEGYHLKRWPVEQREDGIYIGMDDKLFR